MRVRTLLGNSFIEACNNLSTRVNEHFRPDVVVGVLTGGGYVAREVKKAWPKVIYTEIRVQRKDTAKKERGIRRKLLQTLPYFMLNWLRMAELVFEDLKAKKSNPKREGKVGFTENIDTLLKEKSLNVLLVDDAIDTGATLKLIKDTLTERYPLATIKIAVITVTTNHPLIDGDYYLFHDRTLVRFPWSNDVKQNK